MICLCLTGATLEEWAEQLERNRRWISMVELRVDVLRPAERTVERIAAWWSEHGHGLSSILTIRRLNDTGRWEGDDAQRLFLFARLQEAVPTDYIDLELDRQSNPDWIQLARRQEDRGGRVIRSYHGSVADAQEIAQLMARLAKEPREIPKLALQTTSLADTCDILSAVREFRRRMPGRTAVWIAVGEYGLPSRVAPHLFGSAWTYASDHEGEPAAVGQVDPATLATVYRVGEAQADWRVFGVLGSPIGHSLSPRYHNRWMANEKVPAVYLPVRAEELAAFSRFADLVDMRGVSVTVPHKRGALRLAMEGSSADAATEAARSIGAANTLWREAGGAWHADNTDVTGVIEPLRRLVGAGNGRRAAVIGAGGAARATVVALRDDGWTVEVYNRTPERARSLMIDLGLDPSAAHSMADLRGLAPGTLDLLVQTTPVGMAQGTPGDPAEGYRFSGREIVYDLVYTPAATELLQRAEAAGCRTLNGEGMFALQAEAQASIFRRLV